MPLGSTNQRELAKKPPQDSTGSLVSWESLTASPKTVTDSEGQQQRNTGDETTQSQGCFHMGLVDENVSVSPESSLPSELTECSPASPSASPARQHLETTPPVGTASSSSLEVCNTGKVMRYLEASDALRQLDVGVEARILYLQSEIQRQSAIHEEKKAEFDKKKVLHMHLEEATRRLTRQVRNLDNENDQLRDRLAEVEAAVKKAREATAKRRGNTEGNKATGRASDRPEQRCAGSSGANAIKSGGRGALYSVENILQTKINAYDRKLRLAEARHGELLDELHIALARRKGRVAAYSRHVSFSSRANGDGCSDAEDLLRGRCLQEAEAVRLLEGLINSRLSC
ncbi:hypothetical protein, conserved [Trypanosoma brucei gambiense DAL972]|uniref:Uncharacterized protein n=2 Tax=Trypanosoma brucei TaxID=5691 RepID=D0A9K4_TRYB9|nr:hypothetical protein, conserved [Trypanosoma brucei gambiense DAL972]RHW68520.1 hypothetical protein DPX39_110110100 [Trypanosoma brucei equiperdum]CBH18355.1 hypothetical protein, conserved [Trypanosoma brucei gambiense DAL972]|eukprot:XP_011780619.1 hypothetical protein, conserved [Trypanosoma brucei gambiense DAL972]